MGNSAVFRANETCFAELLTDLRKHRGDLGGLRWFTSDPKLTGDKLTVKQLRHCTDYEYIYLTALGFRAIYLNERKIIQLNNGEKYARNPGTRLMETKCGITMHGDREGAVVCVKNALDVLLSAYRLGRKNDSAIKFFREAFERTADPCLEGRVSRLLTYIESMMVHDLNVGSRPWEDFGIRPLNSSSPLEVVGEYLRVFTNECVWTWSKRNKMAYARAKHKQAYLELEDIQCTAPAFMKYLTASKVVPDLVSESAARDAMEHYISLDTLARDGTRRYAPRKVNALSGARLRVECAKA